MRTMSSSLVVTGFVAGLCLLNTGCTENNSTIFVRSVAHLETECTLTPGPEVPTLASGAVDPAVRLVYEAALVIGNQLIRRGDEAQFKVETSRVVFNEAEVEVFDFSGGSRGAFSVPVAGFADPSNNGEPGYGAAFVALIDPATMQTLTPGETVVARVKVYGESLGGTDVETGYFDYPINVLNPGGLIDPLVTQVDCTAATAEGECPCNVGQDDYYSPVCHASSNPCPPP